MTHMKACRPNIKGTQILKTFLDHQIGIIQFSPPSSPRADALHIVYVVSYNCVGCVYEEL